MFTAQNKLIELLEYNPQLILMLPRFGMKLGFGEKKVEQLCQENNIPISLFLLICNAYTFDDYTPSESEIKEIDGNVLINYLIASHDYYLNHRLKHIGKHINKIAQEAGDIGTILLKFFHEYEKDVAYHFKNEEENLFPNIRKNLAATSSGINKIDFSHTHENIGDKLTDLTNIIIKYLPSEVMSNERIGVWFDIIQLTKDLEKHTDIEEKILIPYATLMEGD
ncbi:MAG: hemerythrin domain-containing protein [Paludibacteraceae bacterium]|nr:hemerythrin domain-containing protein [Paludibacteraceae bacterium]